VNLGEIPTKKWEMIHMEMMELDDEVGIG